ncbi:lipoprotein bor [Marinomonas sp. S3726]|uniref:Bor family protein n=1 Tax=Marinomonas sp. S3726 TaxID=579484 RepID=UPI0005FA4054|nr:Bor family protein [Marinomonas sp. S3726]KJZ14187.1 lipoprotein bor [Marinomonas sp. S3726]
MKKTLAVAALTTLLLAGCSTQKFNLNPGADLTSDASLTTSQTFFVSGIGQETEVNAAEVCGSADKVAQVLTKQTFINGLLGAVTFGIYTPRTVEVRCVG